MSRRTAKGLLFSVLPLVMVYIVAEAMLSTFNTTVFATAPPTTAEVRQHETSPWGDVREVGRLTFLGVPVKVERLASLPELRLRAFLPPVERPAGVKRIVLIGDSFVFGAGVADYETIGSLLGERLRAAQPDLQVQTVSLASPAANTTHYVKLASEALAYSPDLVILGFFVGNDAETEFLRETQGPAGTSSLVSVRNALLTHSRTLSAVYSLARPFESTRRQDLYMASTFDNAEKWATVERNLAAIDQQLTSRGIRTVVLIYPYLFSSPRLGLNELSSYRYRQYHDRVRTATGRYFDVVDALDYFTAEHVTSFDDYIVVGDGHPNGRFNALVADHLAPHVMSRSYLVGANPEN